MLKEKAAFLQKHDQALFGKDFRDHLTESLKAKKQSIDAIAEVSKSTNRKRPFREGPSFYQGRPNGGQKFRSSYNGKHILFQKKGTLSQHQQNFTSNYDNHGGINSCSSNSKKVIFHSKNSKLRPSKEDKGISPSLETIDKRSRTLGFSKGYLIPLVMDPVQEKAPKVPKLNQEQQKQVDLVVKAMLEKGSISKVCHSKGEFLSSLSEVSKKDGEIRPVINLKDLNRFIPYERFKMEGLHCLKYVLQKRDYMCKIDLKNAYFSVPLHKDSRKLVRFLWAGNLYEFLCLCFGLRQAPKMFTKLLKVPISILRRLMIRVIIYLDDLLILGNSMSKIITARDSVIFLLQHLGFVINLKKCMFDPVQDIEFFDLIVNSQAMTLSLPKEKIVKIKDQCLSLYKASEVSLLDLI